MFRVVVVMFQVCVVLTACVAFGGMTEAQTAGAQNPFVPEGEPESGVAAGAPRADLYRAKHNASEIVFVNHAQGIASGLLQDAVIHPDECSVEVRVGETFADLSFTITIPVRTLEINDPVVKERVYPRLEALGILDEPVEAMPERRKRRMDEERLDAENNPYIVARTRSIEATGRAGHYRVTTEISLRDVTRTVVWPLRIEETEEELVVETWGQLRFTDFGMEPFSVLFGAVEYEDAFDVYARLNAEPVSAEEAEGT